MRICVTFEIANIFLNNQKQLNNSCKYLGGDVILKCDMYKYIGAN